MSLTQFLKDNIYDPDTHAKPDVKTDNTRPVPISKKSFINNVPEPTEDASSQTGELVSNDLVKAREKIASMLKGANLPGIDYYELIQAKNDMNMIPDEGDRYRAAFKNLTYAGLTKAIVLSSAATYQGKLDNEINTFQMQLNQVQQSDVVGKKAAIAQNQHQIDLLTDQIQKLKDSVAQMTAEVTQSEANLNSKANAFLQAAHEAKQTIMTELNKINQYIS